MGAENIDFIIRGKATRSQIETAFKNRREEDRERNGHRGGYSGDFQTVHSINFNYLGEPMDYNRAYELALDKAKKWDTVVAVYFYDTDQIDSKTLEKYRTQLKNLDGEYYKSNEARRNEINKEIQNIRSKYHSEKMKLIAKAIDKKTCPVSTLVAGWGAS